MSQQEDLPEKRRTALRADTDALASQVAQTQDERWAQFAEDADEVPDDYNPEDDEFFTGKVKKAQPKVKKEPKERPAKAKPEPKQTGPKQMSLFATQTATQKLDVDAMLKNAGGVAADEEGVDKDLLNQLLMPADEEDDSDDDQPLDMQALLFGAPKPAEEEQDEVAVPIETTKKENVITFHAQDAVEAQAAAPVKQVPKAAAALPTATPAATSAPNFVTVKNEAEVKTEIKEEALASDVQYDTVAEAAPQTELSGEESQIYWIDAKEQSHYSHVDPGSITLFGRYPQETTKGTVWNSCCVRVRNMQRCVMILPRADRDELQVVQEINTVCRQAGIESRRIKAVQRYYAFEEKGIPKEKSTWLKLRYPASFPAFPADRLNSAQFVAGANRSLLELFLIKRKLKGPSLLKIKDLQQVPPQHRISHCHMEFVVDDPKKISPIESTFAPKLTAMSIQLSAQLDSTGSKNEIFGIGITVTRNVDINGGSKEIVGARHFAAIRPFDRNTPLPYDTEAVCRRKNLSCLKVCDSEAQLLTWLLERYKEVDPDIIIGHNFVSFTLDVLLHRLSELRVPNWSILGRLQLKQMPKLQTGAGGTRDSTYQEKEVCIGRMLCDTYLLGREYYKTTNYKLLNLAFLMGVRGLGGVISQQEAEEAPIMVSKDVMTNSTRIFELLTRGLNASVLALGVAYHIDVIPLTKRLCTLAGTLWSRTLNGSRAERIEYLLMHAFHQLKFVTPDKKAYGDSKKTTRDEMEAEGDDNDGKRKSKYKGGMVLEPKRGLYTDYILLLDFNSLYPSLIQEFNICFTTVARGDDIESDIPDQSSLVCEECAAAGAPAPCPHRCILPKVISRLVQSRREVKKLMKTERNDSQRAQLNIRQLALKLTANSMYGCLGFEHSRFYAQALAELVTRQGRQALQSTVDLVPTVHPSLQVIYGDTDSVMIQTGIRDDLALVREMAEKIKGEVNKRYRALEIDIDGVFRSILLSRKKKYAAMNVIDFQGKGANLKKEVKGLDMVRRDWCPLVRRCCNDILDKLLSTSADDAIDFITSYMQGVALKVRRGDSFELGEFIISKSLTKEPEHYKEGGFPHAAVALRMKERNESVRVGDLIPYVICELGDDQQIAHGQSKLAAKAFHADEVKRSPRRLDAEWYLETQIFPPVMRLCEVIDGFSPNHLAEVMNLKQPHIQQTNTAETLNAEYSAAFKSSNLEACFPGADMLQIVCHKCMKMTPVQPHTLVERRMKEHPNDFTPFSLYVCENCGAEVPINHLTNQLAMTCNNYIRKFYRNGGSKDELVKLRQQVCYFRALFDVPHMPGAPREIKSLHRHQALRCIRADGKLCTNIEYEQDDDAINPPLEYIKMVYNRMQAMSVELPVVMTAFHLQD